MKEVIPQRRFLTGFLEKMQKKTTVKYLSDVNVDFFLSKRLKFSPHKFKAVSKSEGHNLNVHELIFFKLQGAPKTSLSASPVWKALNVSQLSCVMTETLGSVGRQSLVNTLIVLESFML